jgi:hypothetical protein
MFKGKRILCRIIGGYSKIPIDKSLLSKESIMKFDRDGPCLTIAEVPFLDESGIVVFKVEKVFSPPVLSEREKNPVITSSDVVVKSF